MLKKRKITIPKKAGRGQPHLSLTRAWLSEMGFDETNRDITVTFDGDTGEITVKKFVDQDKKEKVGKKDIRVIRLVGGGGTHCRLNLTTAWLRVMGISRESREVMVRFDSVNKKIVINSDNFIKENFIKEYKTKTNKINIFSKGSTLNLSTAWLSELGISRESREVMVEKLDKKIVISPYDCVREGEVKRNKVTFAVRGSHVSLPLKWLSEMGVSADDREVCLDLDNENKRILIYKK